MLTWEIVQICYTVQVTGNKKEWWSCLKHVPNNRTCALYRLWWLLLCGNFPGPQGAQIFGQTLFWVFLCGCFWMRLTFKKMHRLKHIAFPDLHGPHQSVKGLSRIKRLTLPWVTENSFCLWLNWNISIFPHLLAQIETLVLPGCQACWPSGRKELHYKIHWFSGLQTPAGAKPWALLGLQLCHSPWSSGN